MPAPDIKETVPYKLVYSPDLLSRLGGRSIAGAHRPGHESGDHPDIIATYDPGSGMAVFEYPNIKQGTDAYHRVMDTIDNAKLRGPLKGLTVNKDLEVKHLKVAIAADELKKAFHTDLEVELPGPVNLLAQMTGRIGGASNLSKATLNLNTRQVTLSYPDIHGPSNDIQLVREVMKSAPKTLVRLDKHSKLAITMSLDTYKELSKQDVAVFGGRALG